MIFISRALLIALLIFTLVLFDIQSILFHDESTYQNKSKRGTNISILFMKSASDIHKAKRIALESILESQKRGYNGHIYLKNTEQMKVLSKLFIIGYYVI